MQTHIFLAFSAADSEPAKRLSQFLGRNGINAVSGAETAPVGPAWQHTVCEELSLSQFFLVLVSKNLANSVWCREEAEAVFRTVTVLANTTVVTVLLDDSEPPASLRKCLSFDLRSASDRAYREIVRRLVAVSRCDIDSLTAGSFEKLVARLFKRIGFYGFSRPKARWESAFDLCVWDSQEDRLGQTSAHRWLVECKHYRHERLGMRDIGKFLEHAARVPRDTRCLLVINSRLTTPVRRQLDKARDELRVPIDVLEGPDLKRLLLAHPEIAEETVGLGDDAKEP